jgi:SAM-dependent methyltransferase
MRMASARQYNRWIYEELAPFAGQRVLEVGCGIGNITRYFVDRTLVVAIDRLPASVAYARSRFRGLPNVIVLPGDITDPAILPDLAAYAFDTVISINVLEHIEEDVAALRRMAAVLPSGGRLLLWVPAGRYLYGTLDEALGHVRRYEREELAEKVEAAGFRILKLHYVNLLGIPGWFLNSRVLGRWLLPRGQLRLYDIVAPPFIWLERRIRRVWDLPLGQSLVCVAEKKPDSHEPGLSTTEG